MNSYCYFRAYTLVIEHPIEHYSQPFVRDNLADRTERDTLDLFTLEQWINRVESELSRRRGRYRYAVLSCAIVQENCDYEPSRGTTLVGIYQYLPKHKTFTRIKVVGSLEQPISFNTLPHYGHFYQYRLDDDHRISIVSQESVSHPHLFEHWLDLMQWSSSEEET